MNTLPRGPRRGYVALLSVLIISTILTVTVFAAGTSAFLARFDVLDHEDHAEAVRLAVTCIYAAAYSLTKDHMHRPAGGGTLISFEFGDAIRSCRIERITQDTDELTVQTSARVRESSAVLTARIRLSSENSLPELVSWQEINPS